jgi:hypothetical protein
VFLMFLRYRAASTAKKTVAITGGALCFLALSVNVAFILHATHCAVKCSISFTPDSNYRQCCSYLRTIGHGDSYMYVSSTCPLVEPHYKVLRDAWGERVAIDLLGTVRFGGSEGLAARLRPRRATQKTHNFHLGRPDVVKRIEVDKNYFAT